MSMLIIEFTLLFSKTLNKASPKLKSDELMLQMKLKRLDTALLRLQARCPELTS